MRMTKTAKTIAAAALLTLLTACGSKAADFDVHALADDLAANITYADSLSPMDLDTAKMFINLSDVNAVDGAVYEGSGGTAEEIIVIECASAEDTKAAENALKTRVAEQIESFTDYVPEELTKLNAAVIKTSGKYAVLSVSDTPDAAKAIIDKYMK
ncbi:MAG: DUF4358 domain-containing protein [Lachnospiraceae bacterium]|nr:DUF4358 domain-containing protein [Lachnospiraceae bacterium]